MCRTTLKTFNISELRSILGVFPTGVAVVTCAPGACAWLRCLLYRQVPLGDHLMLVGQVEALGNTKKEPLVFSGGKFSYLAVEESEDRAA